MTHSIYIDHPDGLGSYPFWPVDKTGADVVARKLGFPVKFVCNAYAKISDGDVYEVFLENPEDATAFVLKGKYREYKLVDKEKVEKYRSMYRK